MIKYFEDYVEFVYNAIENDMDELDFYMELIEQGVTADKLDEWYGQHSLRGYVFTLFCEEHGLDDLVKSKSEGL
jgi:hypothetical protein